MSGTGQSGLGENPSLQNSTSKDRLSWGRLVAFALPAAPISALGLPLVVHLPHFYDRHTTLTAAAVGLIFMIARFWDVFTDPVLGLLSDKFETRWGRRRHWIVASVPIMLISVFMVFMPPEGAGALYLTFWMFFLYVGWTLLTVSHMSWGAELTPDYHERSRVQGVREMLLIFGMVFVLVLPVLSAYLVPAESRPEAVTLMGWFVIIFLPITVCIAVSSVGEVKTPQPDHFTWGEAVALIKRNRPLQILLSADLFSGIGNGIVSSLFLYLALDVLMLGNFSNVLLLVYFISGLSFVGPAIWLSNRVGKHKAAIFSSLFSGLTVPLIFLLPEGNYVLSALCWTVLGVNMGAGPFLFRSIMADVVDHDAVESGHQRTGLFYALLTSTNKIGYAIAIGISMASLDWLGIETGKENTEEALFGLQLIYILPSFTISLIVAWLLSYFPLGEVQQRANREILAKRTLDAAAEAIAVRTIEPVNVNSAVSEGAPRTDP
ncbi:MAG: Na+/melibiose symporter-like transporter [Parvibaculaceae bacterium]|jgi:Na+/melibiose symporter-like transporter